MRLSSGFMLLRNTPVTRALGRAYLTALQRRRGDDEQNVLADVLLTMSGAQAVAANAARRGVALRMHVLDSQRFSNGFRFYESRHRQPINASAIVAVHQQAVAAQAMAWAGTQASMSMRSQPRA